MTEWLCAQCGKPGVPQSGYTLMDPRYAVGQCTGDHVGKQHLVRADVRTTERTRKKRKKGQSKRG